MAITDEQVRVTIKFQWTCPDCGEVSETDIEPNAGEVVECDACPVGKGVVA